ncbi:MAG: hypothetical protein ACHQ50_08525 [Fimbriimonadales bacterium]
MAGRTTTAIKNLLKKATKDAEALQARLESGEEVSEEEMTKIAQGVVEALEEANAMLREMLGPMDTALLREEMVKDMTPEEFEQWSEDNAALQEYRAEKRKERKGG